jgi:serine/threonine-protein kinase HipA
MTQRILVAYINHQQVGTLEDNNGTWSFTYSEEWLQDGYELSPALPLTAGAIVDKSTFRNVQNFFDNLLPEEAARRLMASDAGIDVSDRFALLAYYGAESAGAITLLPEGTKPDSSIEKQPLSYAALSTRINNLPQISLNSDAPKRMSLAGAQHKLPVCYSPDSGEISEPVGSTASTHILKPDHNDTEHYPHSALNEFFIMSLAKKAGLDVPEVYTLHIPEAVYIVERFDRASSDSAKDVTHRRHAIDGCQLLLLAPESKYDKCTVENLITLADKCAQPARTRRQIFNWIVFNFITGNADAHLKNLSFFTGKEGLEMTPHYDLLNTTSYATTQANWMDTHMVSELAGVKKFGDVTITTLLDVAKQMRVGAEKNILKDISQMCQRVLESSQLIYQELESRNAEKPDHLKLTPGEFQHLRAIIHGPISEACTQLSS